jgi:predicted anti-sigma-YlaC factor YlaD
MLSCKELTEIATDYLEQDLPRGKRLSVRVHLWMCRHCRRYLDQMRKVVGLLRRLPKETVSPDMVERLLPHFREYCDKHAPSR